MKKTKIKGKTREELHGPSCRCRRCRSREEAILRDKTRIKSVKEYQEYYDD